MKIVGLIKEIEVNAFIKYNSQGHTYMALITAHSITRTHKIELQCFSYVNMLDQIILSNLKSKS